MMLRAGFRWYYRIVCERRNRQCYYRRFAGIVYSLGANAVLPRNHMCVLSKQPRLAVGRCRIQFFLTISVQVL